MGSSVSGEGPVLLTGGAGFIGARLARRLLAAGRSVVLADVADTGRNRDLEGVPEVERVVLDVRDGALVDQLVLASERVVHLAAVVGVDTYMKAPREVLDVNVLGTRNVLESCLRHGRPVLLTSSSEVYGKSGRRLHESGDGVFGPLENLRWCYAVSKAAGEAWAHALGQEGLRYAIVRYFNVYGPEMDRPGEGRVLAKFLGAVRDGRPLVLVDGGEAVRAFCYVDDAVEATARLALGIEGWSGRTFNVGRDEPVTIAELARRVLRLSGHGAGTVDVDGRAFFGHGFEEIPRRVPDVTALREATGFEATIDLDEGLRRTLDHWGLLSPSPEPPPPAPAVLATIRVDLEPDDSLLGALDLVLRSGHVTNEGPRVGAFERDVAAWLGVPEVAAVGSGTSALTLALAALDLGPGAAVLPSFTYIATLSAVVHAGLEPVFCDVDPETWTLDTAHLARVLDARDDVRVVVPVTAYGVPPDLDALGAIAARRRVPVVLDHAHGFGTEVRGRRVPEGPAAVAWSLHATKVLPAVEGGLVAAGDPALLREVRRLRAHGLAADRLDSTPGWNARMDELRATVASHSLGRIDRILSRRRHGNEVLREALPALYQRQRVPEGVVPNGQNLAVLWRGAAPVEAAADRFRDLGVEARRYFWPPLHHLRAYAGRADLPVTDDLASRVVCLPLSEAHGPRERERVLQTARDVAERLGS